MREFRQEKTFLWTIRMDAGTMSLERKSIEPKRIRVLSPLPFFFKRQHSLTHQPNSDQEGTYRLGCVLQLIAGFERQIKEILFDKGIALPQTSKWKNHPKLNGAYRYDI